MNATSGALGYMGRNFIAPWVDVDNDGDLDIFVPGTTTASRLIRNDAGTWVDATSGALAPAGGGVAWGDYDNDGDLDAYCAAYSPSPNRLVRNDGGTWTDVTSGPLGDTGNSTGVAWGDYDNDGDLDLYLANSGSANKLFRNDGGSWADVTTGPLGDTGASYGPAWGDYDADGDLDLFVANHGTNRLLRNENANGNHWLHVKLVGTVSNSSAIGARLRLVAGGVTRIQEVSGGSGPSSQNSLTAEFGLGGSTTIDSLVIRWPSGIVSHTTAISANQRIVMVEPATTGVVVLPLPSAVALASGVPSPFGESTRLDYALPAAGRAKVTIHDLHGRHVATLVDRDHEAGRHSVTWSGRHAGGLRAAAGVYFARLETKSKAGVLVRKMC